MNIAFINHKGGIGKTTLAVNTAFRSKEMKKTLLLLDFDEQRNSMQLYSGYAWENEGEWQEDAYVKLLMANSDMAISVGSFENIPFDCPPSYSSADTFIRFLQKNGIGIDIWVVPIESRTSISGANTVVKKIRTIFPSSRVVLVLNRCVSGDITQADRTEAAMFPNIELCKIIIPVSNVGLTMFEQKGGKPVWLYYKNRAATRMKMFCEALLRGMPYSIVIRNEADVIVDETRKSFAIQPIRRKMDYGTWR